MKGSRLSEDWEPTAAEVAWAKAKRPDLDISEQADWFRDFWLAKTGSNATKLNWSATWRNWIRAARGTQASFQNAPTTRHKTPESTQRELSTIRRPHVREMPTQAVDLFRMLKITGE